MLAWLVRHEPETVARAAAVLLPKDAVRATLLPGADVAVTDRSDASATLLWDVAADGWSAAAVAAAGIPGELLPAVRPSTEVAGTAELPVGEVPVVVGGADTPLALLAAGTTTGVQLNLGTGVQLLRPGLTPRPVDEPLVHSYADAAGGWYAMAALENGGSAWSWVCGVLGMSWAELFDAAASAPAGAGGVPLLALPRRGARRGRRPGRPRRRGPVCTRAPPARTSRARPWRASPAPSARRSRCWPCRTTATPVVLTGGRCAVGAGPAAARRRPAPAGPARARAQRLRGRCGDARGPGDRRRRRPPVDAGPLVEPRVRAASLSR